MACDVDLFRKLQANMAGPNAQPSWRNRAYELHKRQHPVLRKVVVAVIGFILIAIGTALLVLPGPGIVVILAGIAVLSLEFP